MAENNMKDLIKLTPSVLKTDINVGVAQPTFGNIKKFKVYFQTFPNLF